MHGCGKYFCYEHLEMASDGNDEDDSADQLCPACAAKYDEWKKEQANEEQDD